MIRLITASAKGLVARASQYNRADFLIPARFLESVDQFNAGAGAERIIDLRSVNGDGCDAIFFFIKYVFVVHENPR